LLVSLVKSFFGSCCYIILYSCLHLSWLFQLCFVPAFIQNEPLLVRMPLPLLVPYLCVSLVSMLVFYLLTDASRQHLVYDVITRLSLSCIWS
jgi:hypothetical protein